jgi:hypothetical protein
VLWRRDDTPWQRAWRTWWPALLVVVATAAVVVAALWWLGRPLDAAPDEGGTATDAVSPSPTASPTG